MSTYKGDKMKKTKVKKCYACGKELTNIDGRLLCIRGSCQSGQAQYVKTNGRWEKTFVTLEKEEGN